MTNLTAKFTAATVEEIRAEESARRHRRAVRERLARVAMKKPDRNRRKPKQLPGPNGLDRV